MGNKTSFKPGQSGNPGGRTKLPAEIRELKKVSVQEFESNIFTVLRLSAEETWQILQNKSLPNIQRLCAQIAFMAIEEGDPKFADILLNRAFGKVPDKIETPDNPFSNMTDQEKLEKAKLAVRLLEERVK